MSKQLKASDVTQSCIGWRMRLAHRVIGRTYDTALRPLGLRANQLAMLAFADDRGMLRQTELCAEWQIDDSTVSRNLERMQANDWLEEVPGEDAREHPYRLTPAGKKLLKKALPLWNEAQQKVSKMLGAEGVNALMHFAERQSTPN